MPLRSRGHCIIRSCFRSSDYNIQKDSTLRLAFSCNMPAKLLATRAGGGAPNLVKIVRKQCATNSKTMIFKEPITVQELKERILEDPSGLKITKSGLMDFSLQTPFIALPHDHTFEVGVHSVLFLSNSKLGKGNKPDATEGEAKKKIVKKSATHTVIIPAPSANDKAKMSIADSKITLDCGDNKKAKAVFYKIAETFGVDAKTLVKQAILKEQETLAKKLEWLEDEEPAASSSAAAAAEEEEDDEGDGQEESEPQVEDAEADEEDELDESDVVPVQRFEPSSRRGKK